MPLHGSQVKTSKRKDSIIWARHSLNGVQKKCGINATEDVPLGTISSKALRNERTHMMLMLTYKSIFHNSRIGRGSAARVVSSQHSPCNIVGKVPEVRKHDVRNLLSIGWPHSRVAEKVEDSVDLNGWNVLPLRLLNQAW